jgi:soluble lytic murein transglycosylase-like protein
MNLRHVRSSFRPKRLRLPVASVASVLTIGLLVGTLYAGAPVDAVADVARAETPGSEAAGVGPADADVDVDRLEQRLARLAAGWSDLDEYYRTSVAPIERVLLSYGADSELAERVAVALVREANHVGLEPRLLLAVLLVENPWLDPKIRSPVGAVGLMQVMPLHLGNWPACEPDLEDIDANICHGARIFANYFERTRGDIEQALLRYNGCVRGTNTPNCHQYPYHVFARAGRASILAWVDEGLAAGN